MAHKKGGHQVNNIIKEEISTHI